jgi:hypothetical protein
MKEALFTLFIHYCLNQQCETKPLSSSWATLEECQAQIPIYYAMVPGDYLMECK